MRRPRLSNLRAFDAAARLGSFRAAAEEMNVTQGAVAQQVRQLEADLELSLFERQARGVSLTEAGAAYHGEIRRGLAIVDAATEKLKRPVQLVTLSVPPSFATKWLVPRLAAFEAAHPGIELRLQASEALSDFERDGVDLAVRQGRAPGRAEGLVVDELAPLDLRIVGRAENAVGRAPGTPVEDLSGRKLIEDGHGHWARVLSEHGLQPEHPPLRFNQTAHAIDASANGQGLAIAPFLLVEQDIRTGRLVAIGSVAAPREEAFYLLRPEGEEPASRAAMSDWLKAEMQQRR